MSPSTSAVPPDSTITFTVTVTDLGGSPTTPTGTLTWSDGGAGGTLSDSACALLSSPGEVPKNGCAVAYTAPASPGTVTITATYKGDPTHAESSGTAVVTVQTPQEETQSLVTTVNCMNLPGGTTTSLDSKLNAAINSLNAGNNGTAVNQLNAFINYVNAQAGKKISQAQAQELVSDAQAITAAIQS